MAGSVGIIMAIGVSAVLGFFLLLGLLFSIQDLDATINSETGQPVAQIFLDTVGEKGAIVLMVSLIMSIKTSVQLTVVDRLSLSALCFSAGARGAPIAESRLVLILFQDVLYNLELANDVCFCP